MTVEIDFEYPARNHIVQLSPVLTTIPRNEHATGQADGNDLTTRDGVISELIAATKQTSGKDAVGALQTLAKLQGFDKADEKPDDERRTYVLRWLSKCRTCELMRIFMEVQSKVK
ncbi:MAG: hypothetical protein IKS72_07700 [Prevotella sp.]|nr:hypothetical protein [Prevotella sp.]